VPITSTKRAACEKCGEVVQGKDDDEFVDKMTAHILIHQPGAALTRENVLAMADETEPQPKD
jgi:hypothetical protein